MTNPRAQVLAAMPGTQRDIRAVTGFGTATVSRWVSALKQEGECHIGSWILPGKTGRYTEFLIPGPGVNAAHEVVRRVRHPKVARRHNADMRIGGGANHLPARVPYWVNLPAVRCELTTALFGTGPA